MKILWLAHRDPFNPRAGGAEKILLEVGKRLAKDGYEVSVLTGGWKGCKRKETYDGINITRCGHRAGPHFVLPFYLLKYNHDIIIADLGHAVPWILPVLLNRKTLVSFLHLHERTLPGQVNFLLRKIVGSLEKVYFIIYHKTNFVTISTSSRNDLVCLGISKGRINLISPGVNNELFKPKNKTAYPTIVYFGGMRKYKRPEESIYIFKELRELIVNLKLIVVGDGPSFPTLKNLAAQLNVTEGVIFTGRISNENLAELVSAAWLNIHSSISEGWGISIIEAASAGTPTVAYDVPGVRDAVEEGLNGIKIKDGDRKAFADAAYAILRNPESRWSSSTTVAQKYSWNRTAELWEKLIQKMPYEGHEK